MAEDGSGTKQPIVKKVIKKGEHAHHGGAWKIAYADFVTAMMSFFLLMWLLSTLSESQLAGVAEYFSPSPVSSGKGGASGLLQGGKSIIGEGVLPNSDSSTTFTPTLPPPTFGNPEDVSDEDAAKKQAEKEERQFQETAGEINQAIQDVPELAQLGKNLMIDNTQQGLRIQIVDRAGQAMFPSGSSAMSPNMRKLLQLVSSAIKKVPKRIAIFGHTDSVKYANPGGYGNWELSADRALASRRVLIDSGIPEDRIKWVVGRADTDPLLPTDINNPQNRRISIILMRDSPNDAMKDIRIDETFGKTSGKP